MFFFQAEDGIRDLVRSRGLGDVYKRQIQVRGPLAFDIEGIAYDSRQVKENYLFVALPGQHLSLIHI